jgi:hypothetical protein
VFVHSRSCVWCSLSVVVHHMKYKAFEKSISVGRQARGVSVQW